LKVKYLFIISNIFLILQIALKYIKFFYIPNISHKEFDKIENYLKICNNSQKLKQIRNKVSNKPKISIISPIYNTGKFVIRLLNSVQNQNFNDLEIILIDDFSKDNSIELIKNYKNEDNRIKLIKNKKNKGTFASRNIGIFISKGNYIMLPDPDDILLENCLKYLYNFAIKNKYELIRFNVYRHYGKTFHQNITDNLLSRPIYQPELSTYIFYGLGFLKQVDYNVCNKFIKREALIRGLNVLNKSELNSYMITHEDGLLNYILYRTAKSLYFLKKFFYYYISNNSQKKRQCKDFYIVKFRFMHLINVFKYSKNTKFERDMTNKIFNRIIYKRRNKIRTNLTNEEISFFIDIINTLDKDDFFLNKYKNYLNNFKYNFIRK